MGLRLSSNILSGGVTTSSNWRAKAAKNYLFLWKLDEVLLNLSWQNQTLWVTWPSEDFMHHSTGSLSRIRVLHTWHSYLAFILGLHTLSSYMASILGSILGLHTWPWFLACLLGLHTLSSYMDFSGLQWASCTIPPAQYPRCTDYGFIQGLLLQTRIFQVRNSKPFKFGREKR